MKNILLIEDEPSMRLGLIKNLEFEGYNVEFAEDGKIGLEKAIKNNYDLIILDIMLPEISGFEICKKIRGQNKIVPIIMLTAKGEEIDKVLGLELGADDYITKPFSLRELLARIKVLFRRFENTNVEFDQVVKIGNLEINFQSCEGYVNNSAVDMTHKEIEVLKYLYKRKNNTVSRDELLDNVWGKNEIITPRTIDNFILKLRQKIEINSAHPKFIITVQKVGYKLVVSNR